MILRKRSKTDYREAEVIDSTSYWKKQTSSSLKIESVDCALQTMFGDASLRPESESLLLSQWKTGEWLTNVDIGALDVPNRIKTLIAKIKYVHITRTMREMYVDGFMDTLLHILEFDDYPCLMYPQYEYFADIGEDEHHIVAKSDFGILTQNHKMLIVIEDKTMENARYSNNWKEDQVLGELFVAVHDTVQNHEGVSYPINIYAIRVVGTLFTFYKTIADKEYVKETLRGYPVKNSMPVQRHPPVADEPNLTAYDICNSNDRKQILRCMASIKQFLTGF